jgi:hypothetical protein
MYNPPVLAGARCNGEERMVVLFSVVVVFVGADAANEILRGVTLVLLFLVSLSPTKLLSTDLDRIRGCWSEIVENFIY